MASIVKTLNSAFDIAEEFKRFNRDYYPLSVYEYIYDLLTTATDEEFVELDVIAWSCEITESNLAESDFSDMEEFVEYLNKQTSIIYYDDATVWHFA